ncbi:MAG: hypothetical protein RIF32_23120 [Leptospirales bacterium]
METDAQSDRFIKKLIPESLAKPGPLQDRPRKLACAYIREHTQPGNITHTGLASVEDFDLDSAALRALDYRVLLQELRASGHIFIYPAFRYTPASKSAGDGGLSVVRYLVARGENPSILYDIFEELVQASVNTILVWQAASREDPAEALKRMLLASATDQNADAGSIVFSPDRARAAFVQNERHKLAPHDWLIFEFFRRLREELGAKGAAVLLPGDRFIPLIDSQILSCFRVCAAHLQKNTEALAKRDAICSAKFGAIQKEEQSYARKPYSGPILDFDIRRAAAVHASAEAEGDDHLELPVRFILALRARAAELQKREWQEYCARFVADFLTGLQKESADWTTRILFYSMRARQAIHPAIWPLLRHHPALVSERWETEAGTYFAFCSRRAEDLGSLLEGVSLDLSCETWKLQAIAAIIAGSEHFDLMMESPRLRQRHGALVRRATRGTIPAPVRWLFYLPSFLHRIPREMSRARTTARQAQLGALNRRRQSRRTPLETHEAPAPAADPGIENQLLRLLEDEYFTRRRIPTIGALHGHFPELQAGEFARLLRRHAFQLLPAAASGKITRRSVVLFPDNASLPVYLGRIRELVRNLRRAAHRTAGRAQKDPQGELAEILNAHLAGNANPEPGAVRPIIGERFADDRAGA